MVLAGVLAKAKLVPPESRSVPATPPALSTKVPPRPPGIVSKGWTMVPLVGNSTPGDLQ